MTTTASARIEADGIRGTGDRRNRCSGHRNQKPSGTGVAEVANRGHKRGGKRNRVLKPPNARASPRASPLSSAFIFTFGALSSMLFGFDTGIISSASRLSRRDQTSADVSQTSFITSLGADQLMRRHVDRRTI